LSESSCHDWPFVEIETAETLELLDGHTKYPSPNVRQFDCRPGEPPVVQLIPLREYIDVAFEDMAKNLSFPYDTEVHELLVVPVVTFDHIFPSKEYMTLLVVP
jgi:hypothetical protein